MDYATLPHNEKIRILDADAVRIRANNAAREAAEQEYTPDTYMSMKACNTLEELQQDLDALDRRMQGVNGRLNAYAASNESCTRQGVIDTREEWLRIKGQTMVREFEITETITNGGVVTPGCLERAQARLNAMADAEEAEKLVKARRWSHEEEED